MQVVRKNIVCIGFLTKPLLILVLSFVILTDSCKDSFCAWDTTKLIEACDKDGGSKSIELEGELELEDSYFSNFNLALQFAEPRAVILHHYSSVKIQNISESIVNPPPEA
jgi:hypothetical protein